MRVMRVVLSNDDVGAKGGGGDGMADRLGFGGEDVIGVVVEQFDGLV